MDKFFILHDMLGITQEFSPRFLRRYHNLHQEILKACSNFKKDVKIPQDFLMKKNSTNLSFSVLFEDNHLIAVKKLSGDIIQSDKTGDVTLAENVKAYIKKNTTSQEMFF